MDEPPSSRRQALRIGLRTTRGPNIRPLGHLHIASLIGSRMQLSGRSAGIVSNGDTWRPFLAFATLTPACRRRSLGAMYPVASPPGPDATAPSHHQRR